MIERKIELVTMSSPPTVPRLMRLYAMRRLSRLALSLIAMNVLWFMRIVITSAFLGRLVDFEMAGGTLGFTFCNDTGFSIFNGLWSAMHQYVVRLMKQKY